MTALPKSKLDLILLITFSLFIFSTTFSIALSQSALGLSLILYIIIIFRSKPKLLIPELKCFYVLIALWVGWLLLTSFVGGNGLKTFALCRSEWLFLIIPLGLYLFNFHKKHQFLMSVLAAGVILISLFGIIQYFTGWKWITDAHISAAPRGGFRIAGAFGGLVTFGNYFAVASSVLLGYLIGGFSKLTKNTRYIIASASLLGFIVTMLSYGRASMGSLVITIVILALFLGRRHWKIGAGVIISLVIILFIIPGIQDRFEERFEMDFAGKHPAGRVYIWENSWRIISDNPIFGVGQGNFKGAYAEHLQEEIHPVHIVGTGHNDFIHFASITGIPGFVIFALIWITVIWLLWSGYLKAEKSENKEKQSLFLGSLAGSICFLGISMYHGTFVDEEVRALLMFIWALGLSGLYNSEKELKTNI